jgi:acyl-coenzyme A thioesterase PaaI-like protein
VADPDERIDFQGDDERLRARAGTAVRHLGHALVGHHAPPELLERLAASVEGLAAELDANDVRARPGSDMQNRVLVEPPADGEVMTSYPDRPVSGAASPWGVDLTVTREGDDVVGRCTLRAAHEGAPQRSHGGVVAAIFDDLFGFALTLQREMAFTGDLYVRYEAPTPLHTEITFRARAERREGRKLFLTADAWHGDVRFASSRATFVIVPDFGHP